MENNIREKVLKAVSEVNDEIADNIDKDLLLNGIIDSFERVEIMVELEDAFNLEIDAESVNPDNFRTIDSMVALVEKIVKE